MPGACCAAAARTLRQRKFSAVVVVALLVALCATVCATPVSDGLAAPAVPAGVIPRYVCGRVSSCHCDRVVTAVRMLWPASLCGDGERELRGQQMHLLDALQAIDNFDPRSSSGEAGFARLAEVVNSQKSLDSGLELWRTGVAAADDGRWQDATHAFSQLLNLGLRPPGVLCAHGESLLQAGRYREARPRWAEVRPVAVAAGEWRCLRADRYGWGGSCGSCWRCGRRSCILVYTCAWHASTPRCHTTARRKPRPHTMPPSVPTQTPRRPTAGWRRRWRLGGR